jgi:hypothetical protein
MAFTTLAALDNVLRDIYVPALTRQLNNEATLFTWGATTNESVVLDFNATTYEWVARPTRFQREERKPFVCFDAEEEIDGTL